MSDDHKAQLEEFARALELDSAYRVLRRLDPVTRYTTTSSSAAVRKALIVDVETTGLSFATDAIIELGVVQFSYDADSGQPLEILSSESWLEDPGRPIPAEVVRLTGITDDDVRGKRLDDARLLELVSDAGLIVAHNAGFDRPFLNRRFPLFRERHWGCSFKDVGWDAYGFSGRSLEALLNTHTRRFLDTHHRALDDCRATLHILAVPFPDGRYPFQLLRDGCRARRSRVCAVSSPYETKNALRARGYTWSGDEGKPPKTWCREVLDQDLDAEVAWLKSTVYTNGSGAPLIERVDLLHRYSAS